MTNEDLLQAIQGQFDKVHNKLNSMDERLTNVENRLVLFENETSKNIQLLLEGHAAILERLPESGEMDGIRSRVRTLERVVTKHTADIADLKHAS